MKIWDTKFEKWPLRRYRFSFEKTRKKVTWSETINERPGLRKIKKGKVKKIMFWIKVGT